MTPKQVDVSGSSSSKTWMCSSDGSVANVAVIVGNLNWYQSSRNAGAAGSYEVSELCLLHLAFAGYPSPACRLRWNSKGLLCGRLACQLGCVNQGCFSHSPAAVTIW